eukprot:m.216058 g.216058  ORF g.216058 m.216058 type:complete len:353 (-) comp10780_c0_seq16:159-1217(-)
MCVLPTTAARCTSWSPRVESTAATSAPSSRSTSMRSSRLRMHAICSSENPCRSRQSTDRLPCATSSFSTSSEEHSTIPLPTKEPEHPPYEPPAPHLDLCSSEFDPAAALAAESLALPYPKIKPLDNLAACRYRLLAKDEREQHRTQRQAKEAAAKLKTESKVIKEAHPFFHKQEEIAAAVREERFKRKKKVRTILDRMTEEGQGPLDVVGRAFRDKLRVRVDVRRSNVSTTALLAVPAQPTLSCILFWILNQGQIAQCLGYIIAFDKHMNMVLMDVTEQYRTLTWHPRHEVRTDKDFHIHNPEVFRTLSRKAKKRARAHANKLVAVKASHERHLQQVLVRGDCVVLVTFNTA